MFQAEDGSSVGLRCPICMLAMGSKEVLEEVSLTWVGYAYNKIF